MGKTINIPQLNNEVGATDKTAAPSLYEKNKLRIAGALNLLGDISLLRGAYKPGTYDDGTPIDKSWMKAAGWLYTLGASFITLFGSLNPKQQIQQLHQKTAKFFSQRTDVETTGTVLENVTNAKGQNFGARTLHYIRRWAGQIMLGFYTLGAGAILVSGIQDYKNPKAGKRMDDLMVGGVSLLVKFSALFISEKIQEKKVNSPEAENDEKKGGIIAAIKEKPMRLFGYGSLATEAFWGWSVVQKYKRKDEDRHERAVTTAAYAVSDIIIANTNKDAANAFQLDNVEQDKLENMVAETIAHQSKEKQEQLVAESAQFLEQQAGVNGNAEELRQSLMQRVKDMQGESWAQRAEEAPVAELQAAR